MKAITRLAIAGCATVSCLLACAPTEQRGAHFATAADVVGSARVKTPEAALSSPAPAYPSATSLEQLSRLDVEARIGSYPARDSCWVIGQPVLVARDFDFEIAMSREGGEGSGLAAAKRQRENLAMANLLGGVASIAPAALLDALMERCHEQCAALWGERVALYGVLYGGPKARLRVILELNRQGGPKAQYMAVAPEQLAESFAEEGKLRSAFESGLETIARMLGKEAPEVAVDPKAAAPARHGRCSVGDGWSVRGAVASELAEQVVVRLREAPFVAHMACPAGAFFEEPPTDSNPE